MNNSCQEITKQKIFAKNTHYTYLIRNKTQYTSWNSNLTIISALANTYPLYGNDKFSKELTFYSKKQKHIKKKQGQDICYFK